ncbi:MAG: cytochrome c family protein [Proteobacteria bacterium]|nr:cytochrome c family protein [Pseudomonadota bacterium]
MKRLLLLGLGFGMAANAGAAPSSQVAWTPESLRFVKNGNAAHGKELSATCSACHNPESEFPSLEGQLATYLYRQLHDYRQGSRQDDVMGPMAQGLSDQDMADLATWYSSQEPFAGSGGATDATGIVSRGDGPRMEPPCSVCHGGSGEGEPVDTPRLAGQKVGYLQKTLLAYKSGARANDIYSRMRLIASRLSDDEIRQLSAFYRLLK